MTTAQLERRAAGALGIDLGALGEFVSAVGPVAVVDLETTGLPDDPAAEMLELGIVLLDPGESVAVRVLQLLLQPRSPLPRLIQRLTGLTDEDVAGAPRLADVAPGVAEVLAGRTVVAHNAPFERHFLSNAIDPGLGRSVYLDTQDLLSVTHPDAPDLRLESFTRMMLGSEEQHRALDDALDTARVLSRVALGSRADEARYVTARRALERFAPGSPWLSLLGKELADGPEPAPFEYVRIGETREAPVPFDEDAIAAVLSDEARGQRYLPGYRVRQEQIELTRHFVRVLRDGGTLLLEGGTGVGKSLAYVAAAIPFAMERAARGVKEPVVISTRTKLLQDQLLGKDIEAAARLLGYPDLKALAIKGRANYVCARRLEGVLEEGRDLSIFEDDRLGYAVLMACARTRPHGEVGTLPAALLRRFSGLRDLLRRSVAARAELCSRDECAKHGDCPFGRQRSALAGAQLIVANHDLMLRWPPDYPDFTHAIADEGHELAGVADEVYARNVRPEDLFERFDDLFGRGQDPERGDALLPRRERRAAKRDIVAWRRALFLDLTALGRSLADRASDYGEVQLPRHPARSHPESAELAYSTAARLDQVARSAKGMEAVRDADDDAPSAALKTAEELREAAEALRLAFADDAADTVSGFERLEHPYDRWRLAIREVAPGETFHERFMDRLESFAAVSASIFVAEDAFAALGELEIEERADEMGELTRVSVESPFPYAEHMRVMALKHGEDLVEDTTQVLADLARALGGRTLGLFTSLRRMNEVAERLDERLRGEGFEVLAPRRASDDPAALVERFCRARGGAVLLGARTFWQGLDIPGSDLQAVVIEKLPFEVPTELRRRREQRIRDAGGDPFGRYALGKMMLHLKQMTGRLIRSEEDRGIVVIVEGRTDKRYFRRLVNAVPKGVQIRVGRLENVRSVLQETGLGLDPADGD